MKNIKIIITTVLLMGLASAFAQQTTNALQKDETGPAIEQADPAVIPAGQPQVLQQGEVPFPLLTTPQTTEPKVMTQVQPVERDETIPPEGKQLDKLPSLNTEGNQPVVNEVSDGPDEANGPGEVKPIVK